jgi:lipopolysaccharide/colanic/teichoic acid biosynthesis glycosyltransferase/GT2 family glycosyltransferase
MTPESIPSISVIIPAKDAAGTIEACLRAALSQQGLAGPYEVIVVDDGSKDETAALAERLGALVLREQGRGPAAARNLGALAARGSILVFTDADCQPAPDWLAQLTAPFKDPQVVGAKGAYRTRQTSLLARFIQQEYEQKYARLSRYSHIDFIDTYSAAYRKEVFWQNGGFNPAFPDPSAEDIELSFRLARKGYKMVFAPHAIVYHLHNERLADYIRRKFTYGYWRAFVYSHMPDKAMQDSYTPPTFRLQILILGLALLSAALVPVNMQLGRISLALLGLFVLSGFPLMRQIARNDPSVLPLAPIFLLCRAGAIIAGLVAGILRPPRAEKSLGLSLAARAAKRSMDILGAALGLVLSSPIILLAGLAIKLDTPGPVFYRQKRVGAAGRIFQLIKLRTMVKDADRIPYEKVPANPLNGPLMAPPHDPRITRVGRFLRRWSLDELPQFWNVLRGEMSLVGPRPEVPEVVARFEDWQRERLVVKPGITGPVQVSGRKQTDLETRKQLEVEYIRHYSVWRDLVILARTIPAVISGKGAY